MASERQLVVKFVGDVSSLKKAGAEAEGSLNKLSGVAKAAAGAFAAGYVADKAVAFLEDSAKAAQEDLKSQALLATQLKTSVGATDAQVKSTEDFINKLERATGVADDDLRPALASLARGTKDTDQAQRELAIAMDIAAARGVDLTTVTSAMEKAHNGNIGALGRLGVATKDAEGNTLSLEQAMAGAAETYKGAAEAAVTPGQRMSVAFQELKEQVGTALLPVLNALSTYMADTLLPAFQNAVVWLQENWPQISKTIGDTFDKIKPFLDEFVHSIELAFDIIKGVFEVVSDLLQGHWSDAWRAFKDMIGNVFGDIAKLVGDKVDQVKELFGGLVSYVASLPGKIADAAVGMFHGIVDELKKLPGQIASAAVGVFDGIYDAFKSVVNDIIDLFNRLLDHIGIHIHEDPLGSFGPSLNFDWDFPYRVGHLASGGIVTRPTLALIGEAGPEAVVPLGRGGGMGMTVTGPIYVQMTGQYDPDKIVEAVQRHARSNAGVRIPGGVVTV